MGEPQTYHFYDVGTFEGVLSSQHQLFLSLKTPGYLKQIKKNPGPFSKNTMSYKSQNVETPIN